MSDVVGELLDREVGRVYLPPRIGEPNIRDFCLSNDKISSLGFRPSSSIKEGVVEIVDFYRSLGEVSLDD